MCFIFWTVETLIDVFLLGGFGHSTVEVISNGVLSFRGVAHCVDLIMVFLQAVFLAGFTTSGKMLYVQVW